MMNSLIGISEALNEIPIFNTHEHFLPPKFLLDGENTLMRILKNSYLAADCISAGMDPAWWKNGSIIHGDIDLEKHLGPIEGDLDKLWPYLERTKHTGYARAFMAGLRELHGLEGDLNPRAWESLSTKLERAYTREDWFDMVLDRMKIERVILDPHFMIADPVVWSGKVIPDFHTDDFLDYPWAHPVGGKSAADNAKAWGVELGTFDDFLRAINVGFERYQTLGAVSTKIGVAYRRDLKFDPTSEVEGRAAFDNLRQERNEGDTIILGNYAVRHIIRRSIENGMVVQIHTGYQCGYLEQGCPTHLVNLFLEFPEAKFVLFHGGYPYADEAGLMAKTFPNVYLDLCWMPLVSPSMTKGVLSRWIDLVPQNKIMWGGDVWTVEECYGTVMLFKDVLAKVLSNFVEDGILARDDAIELAKGILHKNAEDLFGFLEE